MAYSNEMTASAEQAGRSQARRSFPALSLRFDAAIALISMWVAAGLYLDGWYHNTFQDSIESFLTPWHAVLYTGAFTAGGVLFAAYVRYLRAGYHWRRALPPPYLAALVGFQLFALSGLADFGWHALFGFEVDVEALLSPPHLALAASLVPLVAAPARTAWNRPRTQPDDGGWRRLWPAALSTFLLLAVFTFFTQFANAFTHPTIFAATQTGTAGYHREVAGIASSLVPASLSLAFVLLFLRRWRLPPGSLTALFGLNAAAMYALSMAYSGEHWPLVGAAFAGGALADLLYARLRPSVARPGALRGFAFAVPLITNVLYFVTLAAMGALGWRIHLWLGTAVVTGIAGLGLSYLLAPPALPPDQPTSAA